MLIGEILDTLRSGGSLDASQLDSIIRAHSARAHDGRRRFAKKHILPYYLRAKRSHDEAWQSWNVDEQLDELFIKTVQMKPRRSASGVATVTVITKPWPCANACIYCPNDPNMPKSYLSDEPACQRAARVRFNPYLQVASRLRTLEQMGHATDKVELIVLGGTWCDYPRRYREWFMCELFRACNDTVDAFDEALVDIDAYVANHPEGCGSAPIETLHEANESAPHRVVGLVVETRPDTVNCESLREIRRLGCTKVQLGIQSINDALLRANGRRENAETIARALDLCRLFGFKTHTHFMLNLYRATPESDIEDYRTFVTDKRFLPDEVKLYPCALVGGTKLADLYDAGEWVPYSEKELVDVLARAMQMTPRFTRVSRMIRDISSKDILAGNKKTNLRQIVDERLRAEQASVQEIRYREIATDDVDLGDLVLDEYSYETAATSERFLQWVTPENKIAGFLRLSLPKDESVDAYGNGLPIHKGEAMIREVHVYGFAAKIDAEGSSAQHHGLGRNLVDRACELAAQAGCTAINVISAIGTRGYYRKLGFSQNGLYQTKALR